MSYRFAKGGWEVRWRDATGRQRSRRFRSEEAAKEFDEAIHDHELAERSREPRHGQSGKRLSVRDHSGRQVALRGSTARRLADEQARLPSEKAARDAKRRLIESRSVARFATRRRPSARTGSGGWPAASPIWSRAPGRHMRSTAASGCCRRSGPVALGRLGVEQVRATDGRAGRGDGSRRSSPPRRSTTRWARWWCA